jgi:uncharacterized repeat protein (TIGR01451 family)
VDGYSSASAPVSSAGPGHEMDPHLGCPAYIILWGSGLADSSGIYTVDGWNPSGSGTGDYGHSGYKQDQAWPGTAANPSTATWNYSTSTGGTQEISYITTATLVAHALANGDTPVNGEGLHFKLQFVQDPQKHKTFWVNCPTPTPPPGGSTDLSIVKKESETTAAFGDTLTYTIVVTNSGSIAATNVLINDTMSGTAGFTINTNSFSPDPATVVSSDDVQWTIPSIAASGGTATETYTATISQPTPYDSADTYVLNNTATIVNCTSSGPCSSTVTSEVPGSTPPPPSAPDLIVAKSVSATLATVGQTVTYTITVTNVGGAAASDVVMTDVMSGTATFTVNDSSFAGQPPVTVTGAGTSSNPFTWTYASIPAGAVDTVTYQATILGPGTTSIHGSRFEQLVNTVTAASSTGCTTAANCTSTVTTTAPLPPPHGVLGAKTTKPTPPSKTSTPAGGVLGASVSTPGTGAHLDLLLTVILVLAGLSLIGLAVASRRQARPQG